ncbi:DNA polymerase III delta subunit [Georgfuchsia toluolica]|uniref:DNA polymerase III subunit delta n=1 Tax=Georgfuchsia toluolica TaxID=424218 RepID=A0A916NIS9_9PROT|nr:DNA polymerase III subunit delta [Georgfuchsia toluolica]CAG4884893.1 DNA polymerase III delta subunit [Georgfuchsia toluolica]
MQLRPEQLAAQLGKPLALLYVVHGNEPLLVIEAADAIRAASRQQGFDEREVLIAGTGFRWDDLFLSAGNMSLFGGSKLIDLRIPNGKPGRDGGEALQRYCEHLASGTVTLVTLPEVDWQSRKAAWFAALLEVAIVIECNAPPLAQLPAWIAVRLQRQRQTAPQDALQFIAHHVEGNLLAAHQEIQKLALLYPEGQLTLAQVEAAVLDVARFDVDKLREALLAGDIARCARLLDGLRAEDTAPPLVLWALATDIRALARIRAATDRGLSADSALKEAKVFGPRQNAVRAAAQRIRAATARAALLHAARIDRMIKGLAQGDIWDEMLQLMLKLSQQARH